MITLNNITVQLSFNETTQKIIFSTSTKSTDEFISYLKVNNYTINKIHLIENNKFKVLSKKQFINYFNFSTELLILLKLI